MFFILPTVHLLERAALSNDTNLNTGAVIYGCVRNASQQYATTFLSLLVQTEAENKLSAAGI